MQARERLYPKVHSVRLDQETLARIEELRFWWSEDARSYASDPLTPTRSDILRYAVEIMHAHWMARRKTR